MFESKKIIYIILMAIGLSSCGEYQKVLNKGSVQEQYKMATQMYDAQRYSRAIQLLEKITPHFRGKPQMERIQYMISQSYYNTKSYSLAAYYFDKFTQNYPKSSKKEEAAFLSAQSYMLDSPRFSLDQKDTHQAINAFQSFIDTYPDSDKIADANEKIKQLRLKLEKKSFEIARQYYHREKYKSAIVAFDNLMSDYLGTSYREEALFYKFKAAYELSSKSVLRKKEERIKNAIKAYDKLKRNFPNSTHMKESDKLLKDLKKEQSKNT